MVHVLLVEDDEEDYLITRSLLAQIKQVKVHLDWVATYEAALSVIESCQHDVYLVDYRLGRHDGLELLQAAVLKGCRSPIILLTGYVDADLDLAAMKAGVADYLVKGQIDAPLLERSIRYAIERNRTLAALHESESRLEGILGSLKDVVWSMSATTLELLYMSPAVYGVYGRSAHEFVENPNLWLEVVHPDDRDWVKLASQQVSETGSKDLEYRILQPDGSVRWIRDRAYLVCDAGWKTIRMDGITTDITAQKQAEAALTQAVRENSRLAAAISHLSTGVVISDPRLPDNPVIFVNSGFTAITGYTAADVLGRNCRFLQGAETDPAMVNQLRQAVVQGQPFTGVLLNYRKDGSPFWNELIINPVFDNEGTLINFVGLQTDVTARKEAEVTLERLRRHNELILNSAGEGIYGLDQTGILTFINPAAAIMLGWEADELVGKQIAGVVHDSQSQQDLYWTSCPPDAASQHGWVHHVGEEVFWRKDGTSFWVEYISTPILENQALVGTVVTFQDITQRRQAEVALRESEERYAIAVQGAKDGLWDWNLKTNQVYFSPRWKSMLGWEADEIGHHLDEWFNRIHPEDFETVKSLLVAHLEGRTADFESEYRMLHRDGSYCWMLCRGLAVYDGSGKVSRIAGSLTDITSRKRTEKQLLHDALHDALTDLPNRALFMDRLGRSLERHKRNPDDLFAVLFLDLDRFKIVNDSLGHVVGNHLLIEIARRLQTCIRSEDTVARLGGDEFVILLEAIDYPSDATRVAERIQQELARPFDLNGHEMFVTVSIGIALISAEYEQPEEMLRDADTAMYRAKALGKSRYELFDTSMHHQAITLLQLETDLRYAIERQEFELHYQPIIALKTNRLSGFEALVRWRHPQRGLVSPGAFIAIAEETGLINPIGWWVLQEACQQMQHWQTQFSLQPPLSISVNLSGKQLAQPDAVTRVQQILHTTGLNPAALKLEITESSIMENAESTVARLQQLKALGIQLSIDDFGTGYSSLSYLCRFPIDTLKIDRSFIHTMDSELEKLELVRTIATLAWNLNMDVVAEGVENEHQLAYLKSLGCEYAQGYLFSRPVDQLETEKLIATASHSYQNTTLNYSNTQEQLRS
ncbi:EAL domain-containing protein [Pantanalinema rosaneae CENA516]|uniref:EAL domain-containing protein n=1 Tax=Pantanalinema rosaneae TaxID=1620701 RepID=UPI003D6E7DD2